MYSYEVKNEVEKRIKSGVRLKKINEDTTISLSTLKKWKKEIGIRKRAKNLIFEGKIEEARIEIGKLSPESNKSIILSLESLIARREGNKEKEKELLELILKYEPKNAIVISSLINKAREKNDIERRNKQINVVNQARDLIIRSNTKDMLYVISTIKKSIEGEDATLQVLVQAEAASKAKLYKQAEGYLKAHKKTLKDDEIALKAINKALSITQLKNKLYDTLKWKSIYDEYEKAREKEICESEGERKDKNNEYIQEETINNKEIQLDEEGR